MSPIERVSVFAPATAANVASGFDVLGFALDSPGDSAVLSRSLEKGVRITSITGDEGRLPHDPKKNTVAVVAFPEALGHPFDVEIALEKRMSLSSGLGSSAASAVAAVTAAIILAGRPLSLLDLLI